MRRRRPATGTPRLHGPDRVRLARVVGDTHRARLSTGRDRRRRSPRGGGAGTVDRDRRRRAHPAISRMDDAGGVRSGRCDHDAEVPAHLARPTSRGRRCRAASGGGGGRCAEGRSRGRGGGRSQWSRGLARGGARPGVAPAARPARGRLGAGAVAGRRAHPVSCKGRARARRRTPGGGGDRRRGRRDWTPIGRGANQDRRGRTLRRPRPRARDRTPPATARRVHLRPCLGRLAAANRCIRPDQRTRAVHCRRRSRHSRRAGRADRGANRGRGDRGGRARGEPDRAYGMVRLARPAVRRGDDPTDRDEFRRRGARFRPRRSSAAART